MSMQQEHFLIIEDARGRHGYALDGPVYLIGSSPQCDIHLVSQCVSPYHATLVQRFADNGTAYYRIVDGNPQGKPSTNGLLINKRKLREHDLQNEDEIIFGLEARAVYCINDVPSEEMRALWAEEEGTGTTIIVDERGQCSISIMYLVLPP